MVNIGLNTLFQEETKIPTKVIFGEIQTLPIALASKANSS